MAATLSARRPKLSLLTGAHPSISLQPIHQQPKPVVLQQLPQRITKVVSRLSDADSSDSEEDANFWSGEDVSSASSEDEDMMSNYHSKPTLPGDTVVLSTPTCTSPFLPPASAIKFPTSAQRPGMTKLRIVTAVPSSVTSIATPTTSQKQRQQLSLSIPAPIPKRLGVLPSPISPTTSAPAPLRKSFLSSTYKPRKSVTFSSQPDAVISTTKYTLANSDLLDYLSSEECCEEELAEVWGMTPEEGRMLRMPRNTVNRRDRKWIGLTNSFAKPRKLVEDDDEE